MSLVKRVLLTGAAIAVLGAGAAGACKRDYDVPATEPARIASPANTPMPTLDDRVTVTATATPEPTATVVPATPTATATPIPNNSYDYAKSLGLEAAYLKDVAFDANSKGLVSYLASLPTQMRAISVGSGLLEDILADKKVDSNEAVFFKKVIGSYQKEIETMKPWLNQLPENEVTAALALNLRNFREADKKGQLVYSLRREQTPSLLSTGIFYADGMERKFESEIVFGDKWGGAINPYANAAIKNITNFSEIQKKAWEVANSHDAKYGGGHSINEILDAGYFQGEAVGSTDKGLNAYEDMKLLLEQGSPAAKAALRIYARNMTSDGMNGSAGQARVPLTMIDAWSLGIDSIGVVLEGHDVPTIPITDKDIALLNGRLKDPLLVVDIGGVHHLPLQWTRKPAVRSDITTLTQIYVYVNRPGGVEYKLADLKPY